MSQSTNTQVIKVGRFSSPRQVAGAIAKAIRARGYAYDLDLEVHAVGERAIFIATMALCRARRFLQGERPGQVLSATMRTETVTQDDKSSPYLMMELGWLAIGERSA